MLLISPSLSLPERFETKRPGAVGLCPLRRHRDFCRDSVGSVRMLRRAALAAAVRLGPVCLVVCLVAACGNADPFGSGTGGPKSIVVGSGDFPESEIVAELYAQTLQANG